MQQRENTFTYILKRKHSTIVWYLHVCQRLPCVMSTLLWYARIIWSDRCALRLHFRHLLLAPLGYD